MATKTYNKTILQTSFTSLESIYYLLQAVKANQPITHLEGTDKVFPQARARISQARGGEWDEEKRDTHAELTLKEMMLIRYNKDETFEVSDLGNAFLGAFNLIEEPAENGKINISIEDNLTLEQRNQFLLDILLRLVVEQPKYSRCIHPYLILFKLLTDSKLNGYISKSEWACFINCSDYISDVQYTEIRDRLVEVRINKEQIDAQKSDRILTRLVLWNVLNRIEIKIDGTKQAFFCLNEDFAQTLNCYLLSGKTFNTTTIESSIIRQYNENGFFGKNIIYYGTPGSGKSHKVFDIVGETKYRTIFHPDSDYASFVGSYKPTGNEEDGIGYEFIPQVFTDAYVDAWKNPNKEVNLVIEEINRGNCAQIFGDLFQLLDRKDGYSEYPVTPNSDLKKHLKKVFKFNPEEEFVGRGYNDELEKKILQGETMILPNNLSIYATMNTSDQSLFPMDSAFKRRWDWEYVPVCYDTKTEEGKDNKASEFTINIGDYSANWLEFLKGVNEKIKDVTYSEDKQMGNYFIKSSVDAAAFINKVMYYIWSEVCKEEYKTDKNFFRWEKENDEVVEFSFNELFPINDKSKNILKSFIGRMIAEGK